MHAELAAILEPRLYPDLDAIRNLYWDASHRDPRAADAHPLEVWNLGPLRRIHDEGFVDAVYADAG